MVCADDVIKFMNQMKNSSFHARSPSSNMMCEWKEYIDQLFYKVKGIKKYQWFEIKKVNEVVEIFAKVNSSDSIYQ